MASQRTYMHDCRGTQDLQEDLIVSTASESTLISRESRNLKTEANQRDSRLLCLPPEIRNKIYNYVFHGNIQVYAGYKMDWDGEWQSKLHFLQTCRQLCVEATLLFYRTTTFSFELIHQIENFVYRIRGLRLWNIRSIRLGASSAAVLIDPGYADALLWLRIFPGLEELLFWGEVDEMTRFHLSWLRLRHDGRGVRLVFEGA
ncbi:hypothetical protein HBI56_211530 [Parastagonospora nodorum]|nr:hypothetical protein HBH51_187400 [Parastagonospora nodorum]KAH3992658.1 hypothetical protein HBI10_213040 [Parastagonospora nodorum]KAH4029778.1 hypothetical protein HBI13_032350 [Parastagonospora nodorum]KAH4115156.1 hypothetical protein HBH47_185250 [Parastagonospora nodorum]KAH4403282.1 hypothetical protein HBH92_200060 [Parastagonospora nodorum]